MFLVTQRIKSVRQPRGGYLPPKALTATTLSDGKTLSAPESVHPGTVGTAVDYLSRYLMSGDAQEAFEISLTGAARTGQANKGAELLSRLDKGLSDECIVAACQLVGYDVVVRSGPLMVPVDMIVADSATVENIRIMVGRAMLFFEQYGPVLGDGCIFGWFDEDRVRYGGYSEVVSTGDGDFLTERTFWDFKVSKNLPTKDHTLQLLMYVIMAMVCYIEYGSVGGWTMKGEPPAYFVRGYDTLRRIGIFNPRLNMVFTYDLATDKQLLRTIASDVLVYDRDQMNKLEQYLVQM